ncbi:lipid II flippase MurJ [Spirosoma sp.]|uniref:lipid II flippase MurJ n=1 Tax=Spirosoma sp. TaxID=1899569 RepID=UPI002619E9CB|nr:lipid II flippase MurJ [Spirosoma sp.]MCX6218965.1 polysaccharide biosynthesis C-terminal domain-containing protein [Spirosoma sp.]
MIAKIGLKKMNFNKESLAIKTLLLSIVSLVSNSLGFLIPVYIGYKYKISSETDNFFLSYSILTFISTIFSFAVRGVSIPFLKEKLNDTNVFNEFVSTVYFYSIKYVGGLSVLVLCATLTSLLISGNSTFYYLSIGVPIILLTTINSFFYGIFNSVDKFYIAESTPLIRAVVVLIMIFLFSETFGIGAVIIGYSLGEFAKFIQLYYVLNSKLSITLSLKNRDFSVIRTFVKEGSNQIISTTLVSINPLVDRLVASFLIVGSISIIDYGDKIFVIFNVLLNSFLTLILSKWSNEAIKNKFDLSKLEKIIKVVFFAAVSALIVIFIVKHELISRIYPTFSANDKELIATLLVINMIGFVFNSVSQVINRASIVLKQTKIMITTSGFRVAANVVFDVLFAVKWGVIGICISSAGVHFVGLTVNYYLFRRNYKKNAFNV